MLACLDEAYMSLLACLDEAYMSLLACLDEAYMSPTLTFDFCLHFKHQQLFLLTSYIYSIYCLIS
jgi:hypothetical protein